MPRVRKRVVGATKRAATVVKNYPGKSANMAKKAANAVRRRVKANPVKPTLPTQANSRAGVVRATGGKVAGRNYPTKVYNHPKKAAGVVRRNVRGR